MNRHRSTTGHVERWAPPSACRLWGSLFGIVLVLAVPGALGAQGAVSAPPSTPPSSEAFARGRALFDEGRTAYQAGDFSTALERFQGSYELTHEPALLFNMGAAADRLRRDEQALGYYRTYLDALPDAPNAAEVRGRVQNLEAAVESRRAQEARAAAELERAHERARAESARANALGTPRAPTAAWITTGVSLGVAAVGGILFGLGRRDVNTVQDAPEGTAWNDVAGADERAPKLTGAGIALMGVGLAGTAAGLVWAVVGKRRDAERIARIRVSVLPSGLVVGGTFR